MSSITFGGAVSLIIVWCFTPPVSKALLEVFDCQRFGLCAARALTARASPYQLCTLQQSLEAQS